MNLWYLFQGLIFFWEVLCMQVWVWFFKLKNPNIVLVFTHFQIQELGPSLKLGSNCMYTPNTPQDYKFVLQQIEIGDHIGTKFYN
jgi:hypothetical protein